MSLPTTHEQLLMRNLLDVFGERDAEKRAEAIAAIHAPDVTFYEPGGMTQGHEALGARVQVLLDQAPGFVFRAAGEPATNHDLARLSWQFGPAGGDPVVTGTDIARVSNGRIVSLYTFLDR
jgi:SnoaL-like domain